MHPKVSARNEVVIVELNFTPDLKREINSLASQMKSTKEETIIMCLRMYFCLPVPEKWMKDSWITNPVVMEYGRLDS